MITILTKLGLDTGFTEADLTEGIDPIAQAGLERQFGEADLPTIFKSPDFWSVADSVFTANRKKFRHVIIPIRNLGLAAQSRTRVQTINVETRGGSWDANSAWGGLTGTSDPASQELVLARQLVQLIRTLTAHGVPFSFLNFPEFVDDHEYLYRYLRNLFPQLSRRKVLKVASSTCDKGKLNLE